MRVAVAGALSLMSSLTCAQDVEEEGGRGWSVVPRISISETLTDNIKLGNAIRQSEQITEVSPGIRIHKQGGHLSAYLDYSWDEIYYAKDASPSHLQKSLRAVGTLEAIDNWAYLDVSGAISQQAISAFGLQSFNPAAVHSQRAEVSNYVLSPYLRGRLGDIASYEARYSRAVTAVEGPGGSGASNAEGSLKLSGGSAFKNWGWTADAHRSDVSYSAGRPTEADRLTLSLSYLLTPQLRGFANAGYESNNYTSQDKQGTGTHGYGVSWAPSERTSVEVSRGHRAFGAIHGVTVEHRTVRTAWRFSDSRDTSVTPSQSNVASLGAIYDLLFSQFASIEPNPTARAQLVNAYLQSNGISPSALVTSGFLTSAVSLQRRQDISFALLGVRDTVTFLATRSEGRRLDTVSTAVDDFTSSAVVRQHGVSVNYTHRLTPDYSLGVLLALQNSAGTVGLQDTTSQTAHFSFSGKLGKRGVAAVGLRRSLYASNATPYTENALNFTLNVTF